MDMTHPDILKLEKTGEYRVMEKMVRRCFECGSVVAEDSEESVYDCMGSLFCTSKCRMKRLKRICAEVEGGF